VVAVHGIGGITGLVATGLLATTAVNAAGADGLFYGGGLTQLGRQLLAILVTITWSGGLTLAIAWAMHRTLGLRAAPEHEMVGIDEAEHAETGYDYGRLSPHMTGAHMAPAPRPGPVPADRPAPPAD
jgi:ammonium transporter, Amt family